VSKKKKEKKKTVFFHLFFGSFCLGRVAPRTNRRDGCGIICAHDKAIDALERRALTTRKRKKKNRKKSKKTFFFLVVRFFHLRVRRVYSVYPTATLNSKKDNNGKTKSTLTVERSER
jgi:hypothetical protein